MAVRKIRNLEDDQPVASWAMTDDPYVIQGDALDVLKLMKDNVADALVTDPPAGIGFMGREWDKDKGGREAWIAWLTEILREAYRVMKPGAHGFIWALPRTSHWTALAIEDAGFEIRDSLHHLFATGFPKSMDVSKALDKAAGASRPVIRTEPQNGAKFRQTQEIIDNGGFNDPERREFNRTAPATPEAQEWDGWGTALAPAHEVWWLIRKPLEGTVAQNVTVHGTGAINIDACRTGHRNQTITRGGDRNRSAYGTFAHDNADQPTQFTYNQGRWPKNVLLSHDPECRPVGERRVRASGDVSGQEPSQTALFGQTGRPAARAPGDGDGYETITAWECAPGCPVAELDRQSGPSQGSRPIARTKGSRRLTGHIYEGGQTYSQDYTSPGYEDRGGASRYFPVFQYQAKPSRAERDAGLDHLTPVSGGQATLRQDGSAGLNSPRAGAGRTGGAKNHHPTVKSAQLMNWLITLITPPGGLVIDPFTGSGSTGVAAVAAGFDFLGIELDPEYVQMAEARIRHAYQFPQEA